MKQLRIPVVLGVALALAVLGAGTMPSLAHAAKRGASGATTTRSAKKTAALHQFSGVVTAVDATSLTVEKGGKAAKTMKFERPAGMTTQGELARDARVTVFYRDEEGRTVAHRVVVKGEAVAAAK